VQAAPPTERGVILRQIERGLNAVPTSSMGRLFDAVAAIAGVRQVVTYEAQAAIELEMLVAEDERDAYDWELATKDEAEALEIGAGPVIRAVAADVQAGIPVGVVAARFHNSVAQMVAQVCAGLRDQTGLNGVALSGGVWQNVTLLAKTQDLLQVAGFKVYIHRLVPPNDGGLSLGQAAIANFRHPG
jgi:hydrogenase maturation protein HypF